MVAFGSNASVELSRHVGFTPSRPGEFHPEPLTEPDLILSASSGSCHRGKATAFRRNRGLLPLPAGLGWPIPTTVARPLRSTGITLASSLLRDGPPLPDASVLSASRLLPLVPFPLASPSRFSRSM